MKLLGIHIEGKSIHFARVDRDKKKFDIRQLHSCPIDVKPLDNLKNEKELEIVTGLDCEALMIRDLSLNLRSKRKIFSVLPYQIESLFPLPSQDLLVVPLFYPSSSVTELTLIATSQEHFQNHLASFQKIEMNPDCVSAHPIALINYAHHYFPEIESLIIYHQGKEKGCFVICHQQRLVVAQSHFLDLKSPRIQQECERLIQFWKKKNPEISHLLITGVEEQQQEQFQNLFKLHYTLLSPPETQFYALPLGMCLDRTNTHVQFRQGKFSSEKVKNKRRKMFLSLSCAFFLTSALFIFGGGAWIQREEGTVLENLKKNHATLASHHSLQKAVFHLEKNLAKQKRSFAYIPTMPNVSDVLTWISTHPKLTEQEGEKMRIIRFHYNLIKNPKLGSQETLYQAKVELEFTISSPRLAREFHESLMTENRMIDLKKDIKWTVNQNNYRASFYLTSGRKK